MKQIYFTREIWKTQMKIEIAKPYKMTQNGSSLLRLIQNDHAPILDLFIRESIQNSLDAKKDNVPFVKVELITNSFYSPDLAEQFEGIDDKLNEKYQTLRCDFLATRDFNTEGLTGPVNYENIKDHNYGNLLKLVYEISKPQTKEGSGGSWGLGKTIYFRLGIGLVIYYSRIVNTKGEYESRLAATLVENEQRQDSLIPKYMGKTKRGIAWWGEKVGDNTTIPITDESEINRILSVFSISPYDDLETGTTVIIPYIDSQSLLTKNKPEFCEFEEPSWYKDLNDYLEVAVQRWYPTRLENIHFPHGPFLRVSLNGRRIEQDDIEPIFKIYQSLYNRTLLSLYDKTQKKYLSKDVFSENAIEPIIKDISIRNTLRNDKSGKVAFSKISRSLLEMTPPNNNDDPYKYINNEYSEIDSNIPIVAFTRKLGMIVSYETIGPWVGKVEPTTSDEYIVALFVLNSENTLINTNPNLSLEEYTRRGEKADHTSWNDIMIGSSNPKIVSRIKKNVSSNIYREYATIESTDIQKRNYSLSQQIGNVLLPPRNFGKKATRKIKTSKKSNIMGAKRKKSFKIDYSKIEYSDQLMKIPMRIALHQPSKTTNLSLEILTETTSIKMKEWENNLILNTPFQFHQAEIYFNTLGEQKLPTKYIINLDKNTRKKYYQGILCSLESSDKGSLYKLSFNSGKAEIFELKLVVHLFVKNNNLKPKFNLE